MEGEGFMDVCGGGWVGCMMRIVIIIFISHLVQTTLKVKL